jgi:hypothetical protein
MFEPHLNGFDNDRAHGSGENGSSLLEELDKMAPIQRFDAFPKVSSFLKSRAVGFCVLILQVQSTYISQSRRGGVLTALVGTIIFLLVLVSPPPKLMG